MKKAFISKELLNFPDCVSLIMKELEMDFISLQKLCIKCQIIIESERDRLNRHDISKLKDKISERISQVKFSKANSKSVKIHFLGVNKKKKPIMSYGPIFDEMVNQKN